MSKLTCHKSFILITMLKLFVVISVITYKITKKGFIRYFMGIIIKGFYIDLKNLLTGMTGVVTTRYENE